MTTQAWLILDSELAGDAVALNDSEVGVAPLEVTNAMANNLGYGTLVGQYVLPARLLNDPEYSRWTTLFATTDIRVMDSDVLFVPIPEE